MSSLCTVAELQNISHRCYSWYYYVSVFSSSLSSMQMAGFCVVLYDHMWPVGLCHVFPHCLIKENILRKKNFLKTKRVLIVSITAVWSISNLKTIQGNIITNFLWASRKIHTILLRHELQFKHLERSSLNLQISNFVKIHLVEAESFHADGQTNRHDEANSRFS